MASSDSFVAKAIDEIEKSSLNPVNIRDSRPNLFTGGRDHPLFNVQTNNTLDNSLTMYDILNAKACQCQVKFLNDQSGGFADYEQTKLLGYEPDGSAQRRFLPKIHLKPIFKSATGVSV